MMKNISKLTKVRKLSIIQCSLESIPTNILKIKRLEELNLKGNSIPSITKEMLEHQKLKNLTTLDLSDNKIINIESLQGFDNLMNVYLSGNSELELSALKVIY
jgi:Leucine-rich repeat (LRR) protein